MNRPATPTTSVADATRTFAPWVLFVALMLVGIACFFLFGDRIPSLLQALTER